MIEINELHENLSRCSTKVPKSRTQRNMFREECFAMHIMHLCSVWQEIAVILKAYYEPSRKIVDSTAPQLLFLRRDLNLLIWEIVILNSMHHTLHGISIESIKKLKANRINLNHFYNTSFTMIKWCG